MSDLKEKAQEKLKSAGKKAGIAAIAAYPVLMGAATCGIALYTSHPMFQPEALTEPLSKFSGRVSPRMWDSYQKNETRIKTDDGKSLYAVRIRCPEKFRCKDGKDRAVISVHGVGVSHVTNIRYLRMFLESGFDVIYYDQRNQGHSDKAHATMGCMESRDLANVCKWVRSLYVNGVILGLQGESMGAATVLLYASTDPDLAFVIEDCGYSDVHDLFGWIAKTYMPVFWFAPMYTGAKMLSKYRGFTYDDASPIKSVEKYPASLPVYFAHGAWDFFIPNRMAKEMYDKKQGEKRMKIYPHAIHAMSIDMNRKEYTADIRKFLKDENII